MKSLKNALSLALLLLGPGRLSFDGAITAELVSESVDGPRGIHAAAQPQAVTVSAAQGA